MKLLVIDNYDSFTYNLVQFLGELGAEPVVFRNDAIDLTGAQKLDPDGVVISPGPGSPDDPAFFGVCADILTEMSPEVPTLGVCLGMQGTAHVYGGQVVPAPTLMHGKACMVDHDGSQLYAGLPNPFQAGRYHSLMVEAATLPDTLLPTAWSQEGELMGLRHVDHPIHGVQ
ncbi:MAG: aminodeoxychorismate/anthranilate synthase component II, partial [Candidatus Thermoplasmatota archaeon]|nr:aminodeoxychorismate/anthranilate synthase component II [Candidatus Thermoplasmatota archaeon]